MLNCFGPPRYLTVVAILLLAGCANSTAPHVSSWTAQDVPQSLLTQRKAIVSSNAITARKANMDEIFNTYFVPPTRGEFETTSEFQSRIKKINPNETFFFSLPTGSGLVDYDPDLGILNIHFGFNSDGTTGLLVQSTKTKSVLTGTNAFGATGHYVLTSGVDYRLSLTNEKAFFDFNHVDSDIKIPVPIQTARTLKPALKVVVGVSFISPPKMHMSEPHWGTGPTIANPYSDMSWTTTIDAQLTSVVVLNGNTNEVIDVLVYIPKTDVK